MLEKENRFKKIRWKYSQLLYLALVYIIFMGSAYGEINDWQDLFDPDEKHISLQLGSKILVYLDDESLGRTAEVSKKWGQLTDRVWQFRLNHQKQRYFSLILDITNAEVNIVQLVRDRLNIFLNQKEKRLNSDLINVLQLLQHRLLQPESLVDSNKLLFNQGFPEGNLQESYPALEPLQTLIQQLYRILKWEKSHPLKESLSLLAKHYEMYLNQLLSGICDRNIHLYQKAFLSKEDFLENKQETVSYRISQEMARSLLSIDEYGFYSKTNNPRNYGIGFEKSQFNLKKQIYFKTRGLSLEKDLVVCTLSQSLFNKGLSQEKRELGFFVNVDHVEASTSLRNTNIKETFSASTLEVDYVSLEAFMKGIEKGISFYDDIDLSSFSEHILMNILIHSTGGIVEDFVLKFQNQPKQGKFSIFRTSNNAVFELGGDGFETTLPKASLESQHTLKKKHNVRFKNVLYFLPLMHQSISSRVVKKILKLNPELAALEWLTYLNQYEAQFIKQQKKQSRYDIVQESDISLISQEDCLDSDFSFLLAPDLTPQLCQNIRQTQMCLQEQPALTHWQLFSKIHPLLARFYQEVLNDADGSVMTACFKVSEEDPVYLEDVLSLKAMLSHGQTVAETLKEVKGHPKKTEQFTHSIDEAARQLLLKANLLKQPSLEPFLKLACENFENVFQEKKPQFRYNLGLNITTRADWLTNAVLLKAIADTVPLEYIQKFLDLGLNIDVVDENKWTALRHAVESYSSVDYFSFLIRSYREDQFLSWLNTVATDSLTALDRVLETRQTFLFKELMNHGASTCHSRIALRFYQNVIKNTEDLSVKQAFLKLMKLNDSVNFQGCLHEVLPVYQNDQSGKDLLAGNILMAKSSKRCFPNFVRGQILNHNDQWNPYIKENNCLVCRAVVPNKIMDLEHRLDFRVYPQLPGIEEAVGTFVRKLLGYGVPYTDLANVENCPVLISHSHGDKTTTLEYILNNNPKLLNNLDEESLSGFILAAMLVNPEDGNPNHYVMEKHPTKPQTHRLISINNERSFIPSFSERSPKKNIFIRKPVAQVKTVLYCLNQMQNPIHPYTRDLFINLCPHTFLDEWLRELKKINISYGDLFQDSQVHTKLFKKHESFLGIPFQKGSISYLYNKFVLLIDILTKKPQISHIQLLTELEPGMAKIYEKALTTFPTVKERWNVVKGDFYEKTKNGLETTLTRSRDILKSMQISLEEGVLESIRLGKSHSPIQALEELNEVMEKSQSKTFVIIGIREGCPNIFETLQSEKTRAQFLEQIDFSNIDFQQQKIVLVYLKNLPLVNLTLRNCFALNDLAFIEGISLKNLVKLNLSGCENITAQSLVELSETALNLQELNLSYITRLKEIANIRTYRNDAILIFNNLSILNLKGCVSLVKALLNTPKLEYLNVQDCILLTDQMLDGLVKSCTNLKTLLVKGAVKISETHLSDKNQHTLKKT